MSLRVWLCVSWCLLRVVAESVAAQGAGALEGRVVDSSGGALPGVIVEAIAAGKPRQASGDDDRWRGLLPIPVASRRAVHRQLCLGRLRASAVAGSRRARRRQSTLPATLEVERLTERVQVVANEIALDVATSTQAASFSNETLTELPTASRNYTHVIVAEAGVNAPLPDRTGRGLNLDDQPRAAEPTTRRSRSIRASTVRVRPTTGCASTASTPRTCSTPAAGWAATSPFRSKRSKKSRCRRRCRRRRAGATAAATSTCHAVGRRSLRRVGRLLLPAREAQRQRVLPESRRRRQAGVPPQRCHGTLGGPVLPRRTFFFGAAQRQGFRSGYASNANAAIGLPTGLTDVRTADIDCRRRQRVDAHRRRRRPALRGQLPDRAARVSGRAAGGPHREVLRRSGALVFRAADAGGHPSGGAQHPEHEARRAAT